MQFAVIGLVVGGIYLAIEAYKSWKAEQDEMSNAMLEMKKSAASSLGSVIANVEKLSSEWSKLGGNLQEKEKFVKDNKESFDQLGVSINNVNDAENLLVRYKDTFIEAMKQKAFATAAMDMAAQKYKEALEKMADADKRATDRSIPEALADGAESLVDRFGALVRTISSGKYVEALGDNYFAEQAANRLRQDANKQMEQGAFFIGLQADALTEYNKELEKTGLLSNEKTVFGAGDLGQARKELSDFESKYKDTVENMSKSDLESYNKQKEILSKRVSDLENLGKTTKEQVKNSKKAAEEAKKLAEAERKAAQELAVFQIGQQAEAQKKILENNKKSYEERMAATNEYENKLGESINKRLQDQLSDEKLTASQRELLEVKAQVELNKISEEGGKYRTQITKDYITEQQKEITKAYEYRLAALDASQQEELSILAEMYAKGDINQTAYEAKKFETTKEYAKARLDAEVDSLQSILDIAGMEPEEREKIQKKILDAQLKYNKSITDQKIKNEEDAAKQIQKIEEKLAKDRKKIVEDLYKEIYGLMNTYVDAHFEKQQESLDKESEANDKWRDDEIEKIEKKEEQGVITKEQADADKRAIDEMAQQREDELNCNSKDLI